MSTWWEVRTARVSAAAGMVAAQTECSIGDALVLLREHADQTDSDLEDLALAVTARSISFAQRPPPIRATAGGPECTPGASLAG